MSVPSPMGGLIFTAVVCECEQMPSSPAEHFSGFLILAEDLYFCTIHFILSCCESMNTHADRGLLLMGIFENCHSASPSSSTWDPASCSFHPVFFFSPSLFLLRESGAVSVSLRPLRRRLTLTFKPSEGCSSWIS